ncbi:MAG: acetylglutamate kinase, partial [Spirochaetaceae bacterium]
MSKQQTSVIVKIGGRPAEDPACMGQLAAEIGALQETGINIAVVHGGGARLTAFCQKLGITARFTDGIRATGPDDMLAADQILAGEINTALVRLFASRQIPAVGLTGCDAGLCTARPLLEHTGTAGTTDTRILHLLWQAQLVPIIASVSQDAQGQAMNINADELARGLAIGLQASALVYISD